MDFSSFKAQLDAARSFEVEVDGARFKLMLPTDYACRVAVEAHRNAAGEVVGAKSSREILDAAVVGWDGVKTSHFSPEMDGEAMPFSIPARTVLLDVRVDIADRLTIAIAERLDQRRARMEAARKN